MTYVPVALAANRPLLKSCTMITVTSDFCTFESRRLFKGLIAGDQPDSGEGASESDPVNVGLPRRYHRDVME